MHLIYVDKLNSHTVVLLIYVDKLNSHTVVLLIYIKHESHRLEVHSVSKEKCPKLNILTVYLTNVHITRHAHHCLQICTSTGHN